MWMVLEVLIDMFAAVGYWFHDNIRNFIMLFIIICPYASMLCGEYAYMERGEFGIGGEWLIPLVFFFIISFLRGIANKTRKGITIPVPHKRFTSIDEDYGEVSIPVERSEELILYMADLEDWLERKGLMKDGKDNT